MTVPKQTKNFLFIIICQRLNDSQNFARYQTYRRLISNEMGYMDYIDVLRDDRDQSTRISDKIDGMKT